MGKMFQNILSYIGRSVDGTTNKVSSIRVQSYLIIVPILLMSMAFIVIEMWTFLHSLHAGSEYHLSNEIIIVFGMVLSHHLAVLFSRNKNQSIEEIKNGEKKEDVVEEAEQPKNEEEAA